MQTKKCTKCGEVKELTSFCCDNRKDRKKRSKDGRKQPCKACKSRKYHDNIEVERVKGKRYYAKNRKALLESAQRYRSKNREKVKAYAKEYRKLHLLEKRDADKKYYIANKKSIKAYYKKWANDNPAIVSKHHKEYRENNRSKIRVKACNFARKYCEDLTDIYIKGLICQKSILKFADITPAMIRAKRAHLKLGRLIKERTVA